MKNYETNQRDMIKSLLKGKTDAELISIAFDLNDSFKIVRKKRIDDNQMKEFYGYEHNISNGWLSSAVAFESLREMLVSFICSSKEEKKLEKKK